MKWNKVSSFHGDIVGFATASKTAAVTVVVRWVEGDVRSHPGHQEQGMHLHHRHSIVVEDCGNIFGGEFVGSVGNK